MKKLFKYHLYIIGFSLIIGFAFYLNWQTPPNLDEARAYIIAKSLSPIEIFSISKTEGHPFLWYYVLMPFAKLHLFYPYPLYIINLVFIILAFYIFYKYAPFPSYLKYIITLSLPFLKLYNSFARCYSLTIMLSFILLYIYPIRHTKQILYLTLIVLLANTSATGFFIASSLGIMFFIESIFSKKYQKSRLDYLIIFLFILIEFTLLLLQFYGYNSNIPEKTPTFNTLTNNINLAFSPLNIYLLITLYFASMVIFIKNKNFNSLFFLLLSSIQLTILITTIYQGASHHHYFYYIFLILSYWIAQKTNTLQLLPLTILSFALIFNTNMHYKHSDKNYLNDLKVSALKINKLFPKEQQEIILFEDFNANIIQPYLSNNIQLLNQTSTPYSSLKGLQEFLYYLYVPINVQDIINKTKQNPHVLLYRTCGNNQYYRNNLVFNLKYKLNNKYCLYDIILK